MKFPEVKNPACYQWWYKTYRLVSMADGKLVAVSWKSELKPRKIEVEKKEGLKKSLDRLKERIKEKTARQLLDLPELRSNEKKSSGGEKGQLTLGF